MRWPRVALGEVLARHDDRVPIDPEAEYRQVTARLWGQGLVLRAVVAGAEIAASSQNRIREGQFLISKIDARHGAFGLVPPELDGAVVSNDFPVFDLDRTRILPGFLRWVSKTDWFVALCRRASEGSTNRVRLRESAFLAQEIPLPPLSEQERIVRRLDAVERRIAERRRAAEAVEAELTRLLAAALQRITANAPRARMGDVAPLVRRAVSINLDAAYPELGIRSFGKGTFHKPALSGAEVGTKRLFEVHAGDLLFSNVFAWEGAVAVAQPEDHGRFGSHRFITRRVDPDRATAEFLCYWFLTSEGLQALGEASPGGAGRNRTLGLEALDRIQVPLPPLDAQLWFDRLQQKARAARAAQTAAAEELDRLLPALLAEAFGP
ncbi:MAG: restriction endonuclease subunit S [Elioraea sp.]|nr:restriction endonuclease subunit S [Elioraea sp.]